MPSGRPSKIIVGLGNPGAQYARTRHNVGFWCVDRLARKHSVALSRKSRAALTGEGFIGGERVALAKPRSYVNSSGESITSLLARYSASPGALVVLYDDMDLPVGKLRLRPGGGAGGHQGIKSIIGAVHTQDFARVRIGIGRPSGNTGAVKHVLGNLSAEERTLVEEAVDRAADAVVCILTEGLEVAMGRFN